MEMGEALFSPTAAVAFLSAWGLMMTVMMLPAAMPMILLYGSIRRRLLATPRTTLAMLLFGAVYLATWSALGIPVYLGQVLLHDALSGRPALAATTPYVMALILLLAGAYQLSPLKRRCLGACQDPLGFLMVRFERGIWSSLRLGLEHSLYCVGCCWALMLVLVSVGAMSLEWMLLVAVAVYAEKLLPRHRWTSTVVGSALLALGVLVALRPMLAATLTSGMS